ncbi:MAG: hypothetical protein ACP5GR_03670, partial [Thermoplasmata archaeon]
MNVIKYYVISISILLIIVNLNSISQSKIISEKPISNPVYNVTFIESGLPANTKWYVNVTSGSITTSYSSTSSTITFQEMNGTYNYTISTVNK